jgi:hypothetical protein
MGQVYQCWWKICIEINVFFQVRISHVLRFISICDLCTDSSSYISVSVRCISPFSKCEITQVCVESVLCLCTKCPFNFPIRMASFLKFSHPHPHLALIFLMSLMCCVYLVLVFKVKMLRL